MEYVHKCSMAIYGCKETKPNQREILAALCWLILIFLSIFSNQQKQLPIITLLHFCISYFREAAKSKGSISSLAAL